MPGSKGLSIVIVIALLLGGGAGAVLFHVSMIAAEQKRSYKLKNADGSIDYVLLRPVEVSRSGYSKELEHWVVRVPQGTRAFSSGLEPVLTGWRRWLAWIRGEVPLLKPLYAPFAFYLAFPSTGWLRPDLRAKEMGWLKKNGITPADHVTILQSIGTPSRERMNRPSFEQATKDCIVEATDFPRVTRVTKPPGSRRCAFVIGKKTTVFVKSNAAGEVLYKVYCSRAVQAEGQGNSCSAAAIYSNWYITLGPLPDFSLPEIDLAFEDAMKFLRQRTVSMGRGT